MTASVTVRVVESVVVCSGGIAGVWRCVVEDVADSVVDGVDKSVDKCEGGCGREYGRKHGVGCGRG